MTWYRPGLPDRVRCVLALVAHPDDESFGLGGLPALLSDVGGAVIARLDGPVGDDGEGGHP